MHTLRHVCKHYYICRSVYAHHAQSLYVFSCMLKKIPTRELPCVFVEVWICCHGHYRCREVLGCLCCLHAFHPHCHEFCGVWMLHGAPLPHVRAPRVLLSRRVDAHVAFVPWFHSHTYIYIYPVSIYIYISCQIYRMSPLPKKHPPQTVNVAINLVERRPQDPGPRTQDPGPRSRIQDPRPRTQDHNINNIFTY